MKIVRDMTVTFPSWSNPLHWFNGRVLAVYEPEGRCLVDDDSPRGPRIVTTSRLTRTSASARSVQLGGAA